MSPLATLAAEPTSEVFPEHDAPRMNVTHHDLAMRLCALLQEVEGLFAACYVEVVESSTSWRQPDVMATEHRIPARSTLRLNLQPPPVFVAEVTSPSTAAEDHGPKMLFYRRIGVRTVCVLDQQKGEVRVVSGALDQRAPADGRWMPLWPGLELSWDGGHEVEGLRLRWQGREVEISQAALDAERLRTAEQRRRAQTAEQAMEAERSRAEAERSRAEALAAELDRLRRLLPPGVGESANSG